MSTRVCSCCGQEKPAAEFYASAPGRTKCKNCWIAETKANRARRRAEMGEAAWLAYQREIRERYRARGGRARENAKRRAPSSARQGRQ